MKITLAVYSGVPNPEWEIDDDQNLESLARLIKSLQVRGESLSEYNRWNRLGYASFWIRPIGFEGLPTAVHVWRDEACIMRNEKDKMLYALGASEIYDMLASQAEDKGHTRFFEKYNREKQERRKLLNSLDSIERKIDEMSTRLKRVEDSIEELAHIVECKKRSQ